MSEHMNDESPNKQRGAARATRAYQSHEAPGAALRTPKGATTLSEKRSESLVRATPLESAEGLGAINSRGLLASGGFLALLGLKNWRSFIGLGVAGIGGGLIYSGLKNNGVFEPDFKRRVLNTQLGEPQSLSASIVVDRPVDEVYEAWFECSNLALCMESIAEVERMDANHWYFKAGAPKSKFFVEWAAEIVKSIDNELIAWRTVPGASDINHEGVVEFYALPDGLSTEVHCKIVYLPPAGKLGQKLSEVAGDLSSRMLAGQLERFKYFMEPHPTPVLEDDAINPPAHALPSPALDHRIRTDLR